MGTDNNSCVSLFMEISTFLMALFTFFAVIVALFGDWLKARIFPIKLELNIPDPLGEQTDFKSDNKTKKAGRIYHVEVSNKKRWRKATGVQIFLLRIEKPGPDGNFIPIWNGAVPLRWKHQQIYPLQRTVGPPTKCDICSVNEDKILRLYPMIHQLNLLDHIEYDKEVNLVINLQAQANEADSDILQLKLDWDGKWEKGEKEMMNHFIIKPYKTGRQV